MTSTNVNVGMENDARPSSKVLKPPGGGSSDIFGADSAGQPARRNARNQMQSSLFSNMMETTTNKSAKSGNNSHFRLFGPELTNPPKSITGSVRGNVANSENSNCKAPDARRNPINHDGMTAADCSNYSFSSSRIRSDRKPDGNPVTGEGYAIANGVKESAATNGVAQPPIVAEIANTTETLPKMNGTAKSAPPSRPGRVPPGGYSSGLW